MRIKKWVVMALFCGIFFDRMQQADRVKRGKQ